MAQTPTFDRTELRRQYEAALEEYRFQVGLNWQRSQSFFVLNLGVLVAGTTLLASHKVPRLLIALVFAVGFLLAVLSIFANETQKGYYRSARDLKGALESKLNLGQFAIATTPGMGSKASRVGAVGTFLAVMLAAIAVVDLCGVALIAHDHWWSSSRSDRAALIIKNMGGGRKSSRTSELLVITRAGVIVAHRESTPAGSFSTLWLEPGSYRKWTSESLSGCPLQVTDAPVQKISANC